MTVRPLLAATAFLTRLPVPGTFGAADVGRAVAYFPLIGAGLGLVSGATAIALAPLVPPRLAALLVVSLAAWMTGAIHLDGLADTADGLGGGSSREETLRIMRDPTLGAFGVIALVLVLGVKVEALAALIERGAALPQLIVAAAAARWGAVLLAWSLPYARPEGGLGLAVTERMRPADVAVATVFAATIAAAAGVRTALPAFAAAVIVAGLLRRSCRRRLGGVTGDVLGAHTELCEATALLAGVAFAS